MFQLIHCGESCCISLLAELLQNPGRPEDQEVAGPVVDGLPMGLKHLTASLVQSAEVDLFAQLLESLDACNFHDFQAVRASLGRSD